MIRIFFALLMYGTVVLGGLTARAQTVPNPALNEPDKLSWQLFIMVNSRAPGKNNALFETWASDADTFNANPSFPTSPVMALHAPVLPALLREQMQRSGALLPAVPPGAGPGLTEESRRNQAAFNFIVQNNLYRVSGLRAAYGKTLSFPIDAVEVKANWIPVSDVPAFTLNRVSLADVPKLFHVNSDDKGNRYAMIAMHVISKLVPNWTWATFEHELNPGRCDILGCHDLFGAAQPNVAPNRLFNRGYPACTKTPALAALFAQANWDPAYANYCLKGSQVDFTDNTGLDIRVGNSITEDGFVDRASCMTCHGRAAFDKAGAETSPAGFDGNLAPLGPILPSWYWSFAASPPIYQGLPGLSRIATSVDFVWSIAFCAYDDTVNPPTRKCASK